MADEETRASEQKARLAGFAALGMAVVVAAGVAFYLISSGGDGEPGAPGNGLGGTPLSSLSSVTPAPDTGVIDPQRPEIGEPAPNFALVDARDGRTVRTLADYRGKPVVLNWYASWCKPCEREMPVFEAAYKSGAGSVVFLGVDPLESSSKAVGILDKTGATYPALLDSSGVVTDHYRVRGMPTTFFIDKDGIIRAIHIGEVRTNDLEENLAKIGVSYKAVSR